MTKKRRVLFQKTVSVVTGLLLVFQSLTPGFFISSQTFAQDATETPSPTVVPTPEPTNEATTTEAPTPTEIVTPVPTEEITPTTEPTPTSEPTTTEAPTPTEEITPTIEPTVTETPPTTTEPPKETSPPADDSKGEILDGAATIAPTETPTPTLIPILDETGELQAKILKNVKSETLDLDGVYPDGSAKLSTDKADYAPTDVVIISGSDFTAGAAYTVIISSSNEPAVHFETTLTANENGTFIYAYQLDGIYRPNYAIIAYNQNTDIIDSITFTDGPNTIDNAKCIETAAGQSLQCTANDVTIANVTDVSILDDGCTSRNDTVQFTAKWNVQSGANKRYDVGLYFATDGQTTARTGQCSVSTLPTSPAPWYDDDQDFCGDINSSTALQRTITLTVACKDPDGNGSLNLPYCTSWDNNKSTTCNSPLDAVPGTRSKCNCSAGNGIEIPEIEVPYHAFIEVIKQLTPITDAGRFNLQIDGITNKANATNSDTTEAVEVTAGTSKNPGATHTVGEVASVDPMTNLANYTSSISCVDKGKLTFNGGPALTTANVSSLNVPVDQNDEIVCTITNTRKQATLTVNKIVSPTFDAGRFNLQIDGAIQGTGASVGNGGTTGPITLDPGPHTVSETAVTGTNLSDYTVTYGGACDSSGNVTLDTNDAKTCTITNTRKTGTIIINKTTIGGDNTFGYTISGPSNISASFPTTNGSGTTGTLTVNTGTYTVTEDTPPAGWILTDVSSNCQNTFTVNAGQTVTCAFINTKNATLKVIKTVTNNNGGTKHANDFITNVYQGETLIGSHVGSTTGYDFSLQPGTYTVNENDPTSLGYQMTGYSGNCDSSGSVTLGAGETKTCTITNDDIAPILTVKKIVTNDNNGASAAADFSFRVNGDAPIAFEADGQNDIAVSQGVFYNVTEVTPTGYTVSYDQCSNIVIPLGGSATCTITNDDKPATLIVKKVVINDNGGTVQKDECTFNVNAGPTQNFDADGQIELTVNAGTYTVTEPTVGGYETTYNNCSNVHLQNGETQTCTITNNDIQPKLTVTKIVSGGTAQISDFDLYVNTTKVTSGNQTGFNAGSYTISEVNNSGFDYTGAIVCDGQNSNQVSLNIGEAKNCAITNTRDVGTIELKKIWAGTGAQATLNIGTTENGSDISSTQTGTNGGSPLTTGTVQVTTGTYYLSETGSLTNYTPTLSCTKNGDPYAHGANNSVTVGKDDAVVCEFINTRNSGHIIVDKITNPSGDPTMFGFHMDSTDTNTHETFSLAHGTAPINYVVSTGVYTIREDALPTGWDFSDISCSSNQGGEVTKDLINRTATFDLDKDETVTCAFTNFKQGSITIVKDDNLNSGQNFTFNYTPQGSNTTQFVLDDDTDATYTNSKTFQYLSSKFYSISESATTGWTPSLVECTSNYSLDYPQYEHGNGTMSIALRPGEDLVCTFTNIRDTGSLQVLKNIDLTGDGDYGETGETNARDWQWHAVGPVTVDGNTGDTPMSVITGRYVLSETDKTDFHYYNLSCTGGALDLATKTVTVEKDANVVCTFENMPDKGSVTAHKFADFDKNGTQDTGEPDVNYFQMSLYAGNGCSGSPLSQIDTEGNGNAVFTDLLVGDYSIKETLPTPDFPGIGWVNISPICQNVHVSVNQNQTVHFANFKLTSINVCKENDVNGDGQWQNGDRRLSGWTIYATGPELLTGTTGSDGCVRFPIDEYGAYTITEELQPGWTPTFPASPHVAYVSYNTSMGVTLRNFQFGSISGQKFNDLNGNGSKDPGEPGMPGWTINIDKNADASVDATTTTDANGNYSFTNLGPGTYRVREVGQTGWSQTTTNPNDITITSGLAVTDVTFGNQIRGSITIIKDASPDDTQDFAFTSRQLGSFTLDDDTDATLSNTALFSDLGNNTYSISEDAVEGWTLTDLVCSGDTEAVVDLQTRTATITLNQPGENVTCTFTNTRDTGAITVLKYLNDLDHPATATWQFDVDGTTYRTDSSGRTEAIRVPTGNNHFVTEINIPDGHTFNTAYCVNEIGRYVGSLSAAAPSLTEIPVTKNGDVFCYFVNNNYGSILVSKFNDVDGNGVMDENEQLMNGWEITLDGQPSQITGDHDNDEGKVLFGNLLPATYTLGETQQDGWRQTGIYCTRPTPTPTVTVTPTPTEEETGLCHWNEGADKWNALSVPITNNGHEGHEKDFPYQGPYDLHGQDGVLADGWCETEYNNTHTTPTPTPVVCTANGQSCSSNSECCSEYCNEANDKCTGRQTSLFATNMVYAQGPTEEQDTVDVTVAPGEQRICYIGNQELNPEMTISKENNATTNKQPGESVLYTLTLRVTKNTAHNVFLTDVLPKGFVYRPESWTASITGGSFDIDHTTIADPNYHSPGVWDLGDLTAGSIVTLTLTADVSNDEKPGTYKDLAIAYGCKTEKSCEIGDKMSVLATAVAPGYIDETYHVGTDVTIVKDTSESKSIAVQREGEVLGASTELPSTGANAKWIIVALSLIIAGLGAMVVSTKMRRYHA